MKSKLWPVLAFLLLAACGGADEPVSQQPVAAEDTAAAPSAAAQPAQQTPESGAQAQQEPPPASAGNQTDQQQHQARAAAAARLQDGSDYQRLSPAQPTSTDSSRVEVAEIFMWSCPACFQFAPYVSEWKQTKADYVELVPIPAMFNSLARTHAQAYYTAEALDLVDEMNWEFYREIHVNNNLLDSEAALAEFFGRFGVERETFQATFNSLGVQTRMRRAEDLVQRYRVTGTPTVVVNGKYVTTGRHAGSYQNWFDIIDALAAAEWDEAGGGG